MLQTIDDIKLTAKTIKTILQDTEKAASAVNLIYVQDSQPGITRVRRGKRFQYYYANKRINDEKILERINKLVIPPAWEQVWICRDADGHLQATGFDTRQRKQYKYHSLWNQLRNHTKFYRLLDFGKAIPAIRARIEQDLALPGLPANKVLAAVVSLMEQTSIRIGNSFYEKLYGSFGLTTLKDKHVSINGHKLEFCFTGKKGVQHKISLNSRRLAKIVKHCRDIPGKELFQYYDAEGNHKAIDSGMVNTYLKEITGQDSTAKDFRTWAGSLQALASLATMEPADTQAQVKKNLVIMLDAVAAHLGNTRTVCKKYYVHPLILSLYEAGELHQYLKIKPKPSAAFNEAELLLLNILERKERKATRLN
jgi:DNA topoisomerase I